MAKFEENVFNYMEEHSETRYENYDLLDFLDKMTGFAALLLKEAKYTWPVGRRECRALSRPDQQSCRRS